MINADKKLTVDDLIVLYLIEKINQGYNPEITEEEFMCFLKYFTVKKEVDDILFDYNKLINRFLERKNKSDWPFGPHMEFTDNGILKPNNNFSYYDESCINPYFRTSLKKQQITNYITEYLKKLPKRNFDEDIMKETPTLEICKLSSALVIERIWKIKIGEDIANGRWPEQCTDIIEYLLEDDLAVRIKLQSIKRDILELYKDFAIKNSLLLINDPKLCISSFKNPYLPYSNFQLLLGEKKNNLLKLYQKYGNGIKIFYENSLLEIYSHNYEFCEQINFAKNNYAKRLVKELEKRK